VIADAETMPSALRRVIQRRRVPVGSIGESQASGAVSSGPSSSAVDGGAAVAADQRPRCAKR